MSKGRYYVIAIVGIIMAGVGLYLVKAVSILEGIMKTLPYIMIGLGCGVFGHGT